MYKILAVLLIIGVVLAAPFTPAGDIILKNFYGSFNATNTTTAELRILNRTNCNTLDTTADGTVICGTDTGGGGEYNATNGFTGNVSIAGSSMINVTNSSGVITISYKNISLENLDARQRNDNASVARLNTNNFFTGNVNVTGTTNTSLGVVQNLTFRNVSGDGRCLGAIYMNLSGSFIFTNSC